MSPVKESNNSFKQHLTFNIMFDVSLFSAAEEFLITSFEMIKLMQTVKHKSGHFDQSRSFLCMTVVFTLKIVLTDLKIYFKFV